MRKASTLAAQSRRIILGSRNGDEEIREGRFKELEKYADTPAVIVFVRDEEAEILAHDIRSALLKVGWKSVVITDLASTPIPLGYIENGVQVRTLIREHAPPPGSPQRNIDPPAVATAIVNLLKLDLGQEATGMPFGVTYSPEWVIDGRAIGILRYGFKFPENGVVITVGRKPIEQLFWFLPDPAPPAHK